VARKYASGIASVGLKNRTQGGSRRNEAKSSQEIAISVENPFAKNTAEAIAIAAEELRFLTSAFLPERGDGSWSSANPDPVLKQQPLEQCQLWRCARIRVL
jgi:hypothetical protein